MNKRTEAIIVTLSILILHSAATKILAGEEPTFQDGTKALGLALGNSAAAWADVNNDGWVDLLAGGVLWKNEKGKGFSEFFRTGRGIFSDFDNDGYVDLFVYSELKLYRNNRGKGFVENPLPQLPPTVSRGACWADINGDGFVDIYIGGYEDWNKGITYPDMILMNNKGKSFSHTWTDNRFRARGVTACDFDMDGDMDIYVSNYRLQPNILWKNDGQGKLTDASKRYNAIATSTGFGGGHAIGAAWGDFNNDGYIDLFAGNFAHRDSRGDQPKSRFLLNQGPEKDWVFKDMGTCGVFYQESYASPAAGDFDNDGDLDLFFTTVYATASFGKKNYPVLFRNDGKWIFANASKENGLDKLPPTYQASWADFDNDGDLDLVTGGKLFINQGNKNHWLKVRLQGKSPNVNQSAIGAQVRIKIKEQTLTRQVEAGTGEGNQNALVLHFGLGKHAGPVQLEIFWPDRTSTTMKNVKVDREVTIKYR